MAKTARKRKKTARRGRALARKRNAGGPPPPHPGPGYFMGEALRQAEDAAWTGALAFKRAVNGLGELEDLRGAVLVQRQAYLTLEALRGFLFSLWREGVPPAWAQELVREAGVRVERVRPLYEHHLRMLGAAAEEQGTYWWLEREGGGAKGNPLPFPW